MSTTRLTIPTHLLPPVVAAQNAVDDAAAAALALLESERVVICAALRGGANGTDPSLASLITHRLRVLADARTALALARHEQGRDAALAAALPVVDRTLPLLDAHAEFLHTARHHFGTIPGTWTLSVSHSGASESRIHLIGGDYAEAIAFILHQMRAWASADTTPASVAKYATARASLLDYASAPLLDTGHDVNAFSYSSLYGPRFVVRRFA